SRAGPGRPGSVDRLPVTVGLLFKKKNSGRPGRGRAALADFPRSPPAQNAQIAGISDFPRKPAKISTESGWNCN
ncbi:hypothetical protein CRG98_040206, partial [Punica granatum]